MSPGPKDGCLACAGRAGPPPLLRSAARPADPICGWGGTEARHGWHGPYGVARRRPGPRRRVADGAK